MQILNNYKYYNIINNNESEWPTFTEIDIFSHHGKTKVYFIKKITFLVNSANVW